MSHQVTLRLLLTLALLGGAAAMVVAPARADVTMSVTPARVELLAKSGSTGSEEITVVNDGDEPFELAAAIAPYKGAAGDSSAVDWLAVEPATLRLDPGQRQTVTVSVAVPPDLAAGGRYAMVTFTTGEQAVEGAALGVAGQIGIPFLIAVEGSGELTRQASLERLAPVLEPDGRIGFRALLHNEGNLHLVPLGVVALNRADGTPLGSLEFPQTTAILPGSTVPLIARGSLPLEADAAFEAQAAIEYGGAHPATAGTGFTVTAALSIAEATVCENLDRGPTLRVDLRNEGDLGLLPWLQLVIRDTHGNTLGSATPLEPPVVWPGETTAFQADFPQRLVSGEYVLSVQAEYPTASPVTVETAFQIGGLGDGAAPLCAQEAAA